MGKGFNNYMCKKFFHPASRDNLKRVWMAEQRTEAEKKKQDDLRQQYEREQELYNNKALLSKESKEKLELNFMYEPPPGARKEDKEKEEAEGEPQYKFDWQRTWGTAPRESWAKGDDSIKDQPFGIAVRNVRCVKCHKYGHINTDKECPLYGTAVDSEAPVGAIDQRKLIEEMQEDGMKMRYTAWDLQDDPRIRKYQMIDEPKRSKNQDNPLASLDFKKMSKEDKKKLLKKLEKMEKKKNKKAKKEKKRKRQSSSSDSSDSSDNESPKKSRKSRRDRSRSRSKSAEKDRRSERDRSDRRRRDRSDSRERRRDRSRDRDRDHDRHDRRRRDRSRSRSRDRKHGRK